ncbi:RICIN domain-containing protein [Streptomyces sp. NBC_01565]|uniref:RICIN domain-containing protein n=1 Tax=unclassified Streptomyces TaxID=2593676 RepID=UPI00225BB53B|nr:RICIN domain-containing protein [Streptomyces sp. NBC_01565]MCX4545711.1 RICIN domain-containing protein [Streptomyces sp. NBC_01565]
MADVGGQQPTPGQRLGSALRALQQRSGKTLRSLESEVMISDSSLSRYLRGSTVPPWATVRDLCRALGADPADYRLLWEEADRCQVKPPPPAGAEPAGAGPSWWRRRQGTLVAWASSRWAWAAAGAVAGLLTGAALAWVAVPPDATPARNGAARAAGKDPRGGGQGPQDEIRIFVNRATGSCLDHSLDGGLRSFAPNGMSYQRWTVHPFADGGSELRNHATGACLDGSDAGIRAVSCSKSPSQKWSVTRWADASYQVRSQSTGQCLDDSTAGLRALPCDRSDRQKWG